MSSINILYIVQSGKLGGAEISLLLLLKYINRKKYNPIVLGPADSDLSKRVNDLNIKLIDFNLFKIKSKNPLKICFNIILLINTCLIMRKIILKNDISLVHTVSNKRSAIFGIIAAKISNKPVVWTIRLLEWIKYIDQFLIRYSMGLIAVSKPVNTLFNNKKKYSNKFITINNGIDFTIFDLDLNNNRPFLQEWGIRKETYIVAMVGGFHGHPLVILPPIEYQQYCIFGFVQFQYKCLLFRLCLGHLN